MLPTDHSGLVVATLAGRKAVCLTLTYNFRFGTDFSPLSEAVALEAQVLSSHRNLFCFRWDADLQVARAIAAFFCLFSRSAVWDI